MHVFRLLPPLEHAPDQMASRPFVTLNVIEVPVLNEADPVLPTLTLIPAGLDVMRSPLRPDAVTVSVAVVVADPCGVKRRAGRERTEDARRVARAHAPPQRLRRQAGRQRRLR